MQDTASIVSISSYSECILFIIHRLVNSLIWLNPIHSLQAEPTCSCSTENLHEQPLSTLPSLTSTFCKSTIATFWKVSLTKKEEPPSVPHFFGHFITQKAWGTHNGVSLLPFSKRNCKMLTNTSDSHTTCDGTTIQSLRRINNYTNMQNTLVGSSEKRISKQSKCLHILQNLQVIQSHRNLPLNQEICSGKQRCKI